MEGMLQKLLKQIIKIPTIFSFPSQICSNPTRFSIAIPRATILPWIHNSCYKLNVVSACRNISIILYHLHFNGVDFICCESLTEQRIILIFHWQFVGKMIKMMIIFVKSIFSVCPVTCIAWSHNAGSWRMLRRTISRCLETGIIYLWRHMKNI